MGRNKYTLYTVLPLPHASSNLTFEATPHFRIATVVKLKLGPDLSLTLDWSYSTGTYLSLNLVHERVKKTSAIVGRAVTNFHSKGRKCRCRVTLPNAYHSLFNLRITQGPATQSHKINKLKPKGQTRVNG